MRNIKLTIEYDGTHFEGWQVQTKSRTVQGEIEKVLLKLLGEKIRLIGSGRTDSGAHAKGQVASFKTAAEMPLKELHRALNALLPEDIAIVKSAEVDGTFHARYSIKAKAYRYTILTNKHRSALARNFCLHYPWKLNVPLMRQEAKALVGRKDFKAFQASDSDKSDERTPSTVRTIKKITIRKAGEFITIDIEANGFLYKMVRNIVGALLEVGKGKLPKGTVKKVLQSKKRSKIIPAVPAKGLCLTEARY